MLQLIVKLPDDRFFVVDAEGQSVDWIATQAATQVDRHREGLWTLKDERGRVVPPSARVDEHFKHGATATIHLHERNARVTPAGSTHPDDRFPPSQEEKSLRVEQERIAQRLRDLETQRTGTSEGAPTETAPAPASAAPPKRARGKNAARRVTQ